MLKNDFTLQIHTWLLSYQLSCVNISPGRVVRQLVMSVNAINNTKIRKLLFSYCPKYTRNIKTFPHKPTSISKLMNIVTGNTVCVISSFSLCIVSESFLKLPVPSISPRVLSKADTVTDVLLNPRCQFYTPRLVFLIIF